MKDDIDYASDDSSEVLNRCRNINRYARLNGLQFLITMITVFSISLLSPPELIYELEGLYSIILFAGALDLIFSSLIAVALLIWLLSSKATRKRIWANL